MTSSTLALDQQSSAGSRIKTIAQYELTRLFSTKRGWMALTAFSLVWYFILRYPINFASSIIARPELSNLLGQVFGMVGVESLLNWSVPELAVYWVVSLFLYPIFSLLITSDQISSDCARGTLRFLVLRSTRFELFLGRYLGQLFILFLLVLATLFATSLMAIYSGQTLDIAFVQHFGFVLLHLFIVLAPVVAVTALTSVVCQSARSATFLAIIGIGGSMILVGVIAHYLPQLNVLSDILLGAQVRALATSSGVESLSHIILPLSQSFVLLAFALFLFKRRAL